MNVKKSRGVESPVVLEEDIQQILRTVKRVPNRNVRQNGRGGKLADTRRKIAVWIAILAVILIILVAGVFFMVRGLRQSSPSIKGTWSYDEVTIYTFDDEGHGSLVLPLGNYEFSYVLEDDVLQLDFVDESIIDRRYNYSIAEDELILTDGDGVIYKFTRTEMPKTY